MTSMLLHPAMFRPPVSDTVTPSKFREMLDDLSPVLRAISIRKLRHFGFTDLHLMGDDAPNSLEAVKEAMALRPYGDAFPIYHSHCESTILAKNCAHTVYRAWHDIVHIEVNGAFTLPGEIDVINAQIDEMKLHGCPDQDCSVVWFDIMGQLLHDYKWGKFPEHSRMFVEACMCKGLYYALSFKW